MTDRDRLIELLGDYLYSEQIADHLLANGVIVPPCKVGDMLYDIYEAKENGNGNIRELKVTDIHIHLDKRNKPWIIISGYYFAFEDFGKTVFLTKEEAEEKLKKSCLEKYFTKSCQNCEFWRKDETACGCAYPFPIMHCEAFAKRYNEAEKYMRKEDEGK